jgi:recombination protein RecT
MAEKTAVVSKVDTVKGLVEKARDEIATVLPKHQDVDRVITSVRLALAQTPDLAECDPKTLLFAVMAASRLGLELNSPLHHASLVPYGKECVLLIEYRGYQELARRGGDIRNIEARNVFKGDLFEFALGTAPYIKHVPKQLPNQGDEREVTHTYAVAFPKDGGAPIFDVLTRDEVEQARSVSRMKDGQAWKRWWGEMARKTAVRRLSKYLPLSPELAAAIELDIRADTGEPTSGIPLIDSRETVNDRVRVQTEARLDEIKNQIAPPKANEPPQGATPATVNVAAKTATSDEPPF